MPRVVVTDKLRSYGAAHREVMPSFEHRSHKGLNNRAENSHQPTRQRERAMKGFRSTGAAQRFLSAFSGIPPRFRPRRHLMTAPGYRPVRQVAERDEESVKVWKEATLAEVKGPGRHSGATSASRTKQASPADRPEAAPGDDADTPRS